MHWSDGGLMSPVLSTLASILRDAADGYDTEARMSRLRAGSFTPDARAVTEAVALIHALRDLADGLTDVATLTEGAQPGVDRRKMAEAELERRLGEECAVLARRCAA